MAFNFSRPFHRRGPFFKNTSGEGSFQHEGNSEQQLYLSGAISVVNGCLCPTALIGNFVILMTIWKTPSLHSPANILLANLAVTDLAVGLVGHPLFIASLLKQRSLSFASSRILWVVLNMLTSFLSGVSFFTITAIGVDRLLALQLHLRYEVMVTPFRVGWAILFIWMCPGFLISVRLWISSLSFNALSPVIFTLLVANFAVYLKIYLIVRRHQKQIQQQPQQANDENIFSVKRFKKSALNTFLVYILLLFCFLPYCFVLQNFFVGAVSTSHGVRNIAITIVLLNSSLNPLLYCWRVREIRTAVKHFLCC